MADTKKKAPDHPSHFSYSTRTLQYIRYPNKNVTKHKTTHTQPKKTQNITKNTANPKYILHPYQEDQTNDEIIVLHSPKKYTNDTPNPQSTFNQLMKRSRSHSNSKSKIRMKKPKKHRFYLKNKHRPSLKPSESDRTNTSTNYKKSYHENKRKKRSFCIDSHQRVISFNASDNSLLPNLTAVTTSNNTPKNDSRKRSKTNTDKTPQKMKKDSSSFTTDDLDSKSNKAFLKPSDSHSNHSHSYSNSELMRLSIGGVYTDYDSKNVSIFNDELLYNDTVIGVPNDTFLHNWSSLEVCAWLITIDYGKYVSYVQSIIDNNINGKALNELTFVTMMKLSKYCMNVNDCNNLLRHIKLLNTNAKLRLAMIESSDDIDIPLFAANDDSNQRVIEQGRFWRIYYFPKQKYLQYEIDKSVSKWTPYEVSLWITDIYNGKFSQYSHHFIQHQIDGQSLLNITRKTVTNELKMISPNMRRLFFDELNALISLKPCAIRQSSDGQIKRVSKDKEQIQKIGLDTFISGQEHEYEWKNETETETGNVNANGLNFYTDNDVHFVNEYECEEEAQTHSPLNVGSLFNATHVNQLSDEPNIAQINDTLHAMEAQKESIMAKQMQITQLTTNLSTKMSSNNSEITRDSRRSSYTQTAESVQTLSPKMGSENSQKLLVSLTTHENKTSLLNNIGIHSSFEAYTSESQKRISVNDEFDGLEIDAWDDRDRGKHYFVDSFIDDASDPLFAEPMSPVEDENSEHNLKGFEISNHLMVNSADFVFEDGEEKMNELLDSDCSQLFHEANMTLELNISEETDFIRTDMMHSKMEHSIDVYQ